MTLSTTVAAAAAGRTVRVALLVEFDFADGVSRLHDGIGPVTTNDGRTFDGVGELGNVEGLEQALSGSAPQATFTLSGVSPAFIARAKDGADLVKGRIVSVMLQFMDVTTEAVLDTPVVVWTGIMNVMTYTATGPGQRSITVSAESPFSGRRRPAFALYTDRDQNARHPGDRGLEQVASLVNKTIRWPTY